MRISTSIQSVATITAEARHIAGTYGRFSMLTVSFTTGCGQELNYDLFLSDGVRQADVAEIYARHINAAALEVAALSAVPVETVVEGEAA